MIQSVIATTYIDVAFMKNLTFVIGATVLAGMSSQFAPHLAAENLSTVVAFGFDHRLHLSYYGSRPSVEQLRTRLFILAAGQSQDEPSMTGG
jgi:hypothetical protein